MEVAIELTPSNIILSYHYAENVTLLTKITHSLMTIGINKVNCIGRKTLDLEMSLLGHLEKIIYDNYRNLKVLNQNLLAYFFVRFVLKNIR